MKRPADESPIKRRTQSPPTGSAGNGDGELFFTGFFFPRRDERLRELSNFLPGTSKSNLSIQTRSGVLTVY